MKEIKLLQGYYIQDWAGNYMFDYIIFPTYEDAFNYLLEKFSKDEDIEEYLIYSIDEKFRLKKELHEAMLILEEREYTNAWADKVRHLIN